MSPVTYEQVLSQINTLPPADVVKLREYLNTQRQQDEAVAVAVARARVCAKHDLSAEYRWLAEHRAEYAGQWVALKGDSLISHGPHGVAVLEAARNAGHPDAFFKLVLPAEDLQYTVF